MITKFTLSLWIELKIENIQFKLDTQYFDGIEEMYRKEGEIRILKQIYEELNLPQVKIQEMSSH